jgi:hypothetical protein
MPEDFVLYLALKYHSILIKKLRLNKSNKVIFMYNKKTPKLFLLLLFTIVSCSTLTPEGRKVRLTREINSHCKFIGAVDPMDNVYVFEGKIDNLLKNKAAEMGGDWVVITGYIGSKASKGDVYKCPEGTYNVTSY